MIHKRALAIPLVATILVLFCSVYYGQVWQRLPYGIHEWAQADRLALAIAYYDNGMNFFLPATLNMSSKGGVAGVEFPIVAYIAAAIAHLTGREYISLIFRVLGVGIACCGLFALFLTGLRATRNFFLSLIAPIFFFCSPVFIAYSVAFLPDPSSVSLVFVGFYFVVGYLQYEKQKDFLVAVCWLTLASLMKTSSATYLLGFLACSLFYELFGGRQRIVRSLLTKFVLAMLSLGALVGQYFYNLDLNQRYESFLFLSKPAPIQKFSDLDRLINFVIKEVWLKEYLVLPAYLFGAVLISSCIVLFRSLPSYKRFSMLVILYVTGSLSMMCLLMLQLEVHDYYILAIFFPLIALLLLLSSISMGKILAQSGPVRKAVHTGVVVSLAIMFFFADQHTAKRLSSYYPPYSEYYTSLYYEGSTGLLTKLGVPKDAMIAILLDAEPNLGLVYFDRKGYQLPDDHKIQPPTFYANYARDRNVSAVIMKTKDAVRTRAVDSTSWDHRFSLLYQDDKKTIYRVR
jgi:hypothetical protein